MSDTPSGQQSEFFGQKVSIPGINVNQASDSQLILKDDYSSRIYYNATGNPSVLLGLRKKNSSNGLSANQQGLFVSRTGIDVTQATDGQLIFNSGQDVFKIVNKITTYSIPQFTAPANNSGNAIITIPHGQSTAPIVYCYVQGQYFSFATSTVLAVSYIPLPVSEGAKTFATSYFFPGTIPGQSYGVDIGYAVDNTNIYVQAVFVNSNASSVTILPIPVTAFVLQETAN